MKEPEEIVDIIVRHDIASKIDNFRDALKVKDFLSQVVEQEKI